MGKELFVELEQTADTTSNPDAGNTRLLANLAGTLVVRQSGGGEDTLSVGSHDHAGVYEPVFSKNDAFNKDYAGTGGDFGSATTPARSDHSHAEFAGIGGGDMLKSVYDTGDDGRVDNAEQLADGVNTVTAAQAKVAVDHEPLVNNPHVVTKTQVGLGNVEDTLNNLSAVVPPTANEDANDGYSVGSIWVDLNTDAVYMCTDATVGVANWVDLSGITGVIAHASTHQNGGADEIDVTGLSGLLATAQTPASHASTHQSGGSDEISFDNIDDTASFVKMTPTERTNVADAKTYIDTELDIYSLGTLPASWALDMSNGYFQQGTVATAVAVQAPTNTAAGKVYTANLYLTGSGGPHNITFPVGWGWTTRPPGNVISLAAGEELEVIVQTVGASTVRASYKIMDI